MSKSDLFTNGDEMGKPDILPLEFEEQERDQVLRTAHQQMFERIEAAIKEVDSRGTIHVAIEELIDACESYLTKTRDSGHGGVTGSEVTAAAS